jgi:hypothetical protein
MNLSRLLLYITIAFVILLVVVFMAASFSSMTTRVGSSSPASGIGDAFPSNVKEPCVLAIKNMKLTPNSVDLLAVATQTRSINCPPTLTYTPTSTDTPHGLYLPIIMRNWPIVLGEPNAICDASNNYGKNAKKSDDQLVKVFSVPSSGAPKVTFRYRLFTWDCLKEEKYDFFKVYISDDISTPDLGTEVCKAPDPVLPTPSCVYGCNMGKPKDSSWRPPPYGPVDLTPYCGSDIKVTFRIVNSSEWFATWVYLDGIEIVP